MVYHKTVESYQQNQQGLFLGYRDQELFDRKSEPAEQGDDITFCPNAQP